jgi:hypothetical protein
MGVPNQVQAYAPHVLRDYALLADGYRGALVGPRGEIPWLCAPRWDSDAVLSELVGGQGLYAITPVGRYVWGGYYEPGTLIWRGRWVTERGVTECRDALAYPGQPDVITLLRRIEAIDGDTQVDVLLRLSADFGRAGRQQLERLDKPGATTISCCRSAATRARGRSSRTGSGRRPSGPGARRFPGSSSPWRPAIRSMPTR